MKKFSLLLFVLLASLAIVIACGSGSMNVAEDINAKDMVTVEEAVQIIQENEGNTQFVLLDVRTNAEYNEGHLKNSVQHDRYAPDFDEWLLKLKKEKRYLIYCRTQVRSKEAFDKLRVADFKHIQYMKGGYTDWVNKRNPVEKPEYKLVLDALVTADKIKTKGSINFNFRLVDLRENPIRKNKLSLKVVLNNTEMQKTDITTDNRGNATHSLDVQAWANGKYRLICTAEKKDYESASAYYDFEIAEQDEAVTGSFNEIIEEGDINIQIIKNFYNRNIYGYKVAKRTQDLVALGDLVASGPALILFIQPLCTGCMDGAKELYKYNLTGVTVIPIITSVENDDFATFISKTERQLTALGLGSIIPNTVYDSKDFIWGTRFKFESTPKFILINKYGQIKDIVHGNQTIETLVKKMENTFGLPPFTKL